MDDICIAILTFNSVKIIEKCLDSVLGQDFKDFSLIIADNGSTDGTVLLIKKRYPQIFIIENHKNLGAAKARNQCIEITKSKWILTMDSDVTLAKDFFLHLGAAIKSVPPEVGIIQPKILKTDRKTIYSVGVVLTPSRRFYDIGRNDADSYKFNIPRYIGGACSAAACYNRDMLEEVREQFGYFDERFFFLVEDVDLSWRARKKNWKTLFIPQAICYHDGGGSIISLKDRKYLCLRNRYLMILKNEEFRNYPKLVFFIYDLPRILFFLLFGILRKENLKEIAGLLKEILENKV